MSVAAFLSPAPLPRTQLQATSYEAMSLEDLKNQTSTLTQQLFDMKMEKWTNKKLNFKSHEWRKIKKERARIQPFLDAKIAEATELKIAEAAESG